METKDYTLTCGEVLANLLMLADAYERLSAGKEQSGFSINVTDAAANLKAAAHFIGSFGQQIPQWIPVEERLPEEGVRVLVFDKAFSQPEMGMWYAADGWVGDEIAMLDPSHWMPLPEPPG